MVELHRQLASLAEDIMELTLQLANERVIVIESDEEDEEEEHRAKKRQKTHRIKKHKKSKSDEFEIEKVGPYYVIPASKIDRMKLCDPVDILHQVSTTDFFLSLYLSLSLHSCVYNICLINSCELRHMEQNVGLLYLDLNRFQMPEIWRGVYISTLTGVESVLSFSCAFVY